MSQDGWLIRKSENFEPFREFAKLDKMGPLNTILKKWKYYSKNVILFLFSFLFWWGTYMDSQVLKVLRIQVWGFALERGPEKQMTYSFHHKFFIIFITTSDTWSTDMWSTVILRVLWRNPNCQLLVSPLFGTWELLGFELNNSILY